jgi:hypothetical protein
MKEKVKKLLSYLEEEDHKNVKKGQIVKILRNLNWDL